MFKEKYNTVSELAQQSLSPLELINAIHRAPRVFVPLLQITPAGTVHHGAMPTMNKVYPEQLEFAPDMYTAINSYAVTGRSRVESTGFKYEKRGAKYVSHLNALYCDFDIGRGDGLVWEDVVIELLKLQRDKVIPPPSLIASSGRGAYALWILQDSKTSEGIRVSFDNLDQMLVRYKLLNKALQKLFPSWMKPDPAHDASRILRVSQTLNSKVNRPCQWFMASDACYTMGELEHYFRRGKHAHLRLLPDFKEAPKMRPIIERNLYPARRNGYDVVNAQRAHDIEVIERYRGGFLHGGQKYEDGHVSPGRRFLMALYAQYLLALDSPPLEIRDRIRDMTGKKFNKRITKKLEISARVRDMAARCTPPYPSDENDMPLVEITRGIFETRKESFCKNLKTTDFHELLGVSFLPQHVQELLQTIKEDTPTPSKGEQVKTRQAAIQRVIEQCGHTPPLRKLAGMLHTEGITRPDGKPWGKNTLQRDLESIK